MADWFDLLAVVFGICLFVRVVFVRKRRFPSSPADGGSDPFRVWVHKGRVNVKTDAGSWRDYGLSVDLCVPGVLSSTLIGRDEAGHMVLEIGIDPRGDADRIARMIAAAHSMRVNPTDDWSEREDFLTMLED